MGMPIPQGIEVLISKASVDPEFKTLLLDHRAASAQSIGLDLSPAEATLLAATPREQLEAIIAKTNVPQEHRRTFLGQAAAAMVAAVAAMAPAAALGQGPPAPVAPTGVRPDLPGEKPAPPKPKTVQERVFGIIAKELKVEPKEMDRDVGLLREANTTAEQAANRKRLLAIAADLRKEFTLPVPAKDAVKFQTAGEVVDYIEKELAKPKPKPVKPSPAVSRGVRPDLPLPPGLSPAGGVRPE